MAIELTSQSDSSFPTAAAYLFGADSLVVSAPSVYPATTVLAALTQYLGYILVTTVTPAGIQAAVDTAKTNALAGSGPMGVYVAGVPGTYTFTSHVIVSGTDGTHVPELTLNFAPGIHIKKDPTWDIGTYPSIFYFGFYDKLRIHGGKFTGLGSTRMIWEINPAGDDGMRMWSCSDVKVTDINMVDFGDSAIRGAHLSSDTATTAKVGFDITHSKFYNCGQISSTNSSTSTFSYDEVRIAFNHFERMNSVKFACRKPASKVSFVNNYFKDMSTAHEIDGYSDIVIDDVIEHTLLHGISIISNNTNAATPFRFDRIDIKARFKGLIGDTSTYLVSGSPASASNQGVIRIGPRTQESTLEWVCQNVKIDADIDAQTPVTNATAANTSTVSLLLLDGEFLNLKANIRCPSWDGSGANGGFPVNATIRGKGNQQNVNVNLTGAFIMNSSTGRVCRFVNAADSTGRALGFTFNFENVQLTNAVNLLYAENLEDVYIKTTNVTGTMTSSILTSASGVPCYDVHWVDSDIDITGGTYNPAYIIGGSLRNVVIRGDSATPFNPQSTCQGITVYPNVQAYNAGIPVELKKNAVGAGPFIGTPTRVTTAITVPLTLGTGATDFTPTSAIAGFTYVDGAGAVIPLTAARASATQIDISLAATPASSGILTYSRDRAMSGIFTRANIMRDNSTTLSLLQEGQWAV